MNIESALIECTGLEKYLHRLKNLLKHKFKVLVEIKFFNLLVNGDATSLLRCKNLVKYYRDCNSTYLLPVNEYSKSALKIENLVLSFESEYSVLMLLEDSVLYLRGEINMVEVINNYFLKCDLSFADENLTITLDNDDETRLALICTQLNITLPKDICMKTKACIYNILLGREYLSNRIEFKKSNNELYKINFDDPKPTKVIMTSPEAVKESGCTSDYMCDEGNINFTKDNSKFRTIIIDGCNVAYEHGVQNFSYKGIEIAVEYFVSRGHKVYALLPRHYQPFGGLIFERLRLEGKLIYTPSRKIMAVRETPYDDRCILEAAVRTEGVVLSNDQYRDLMKEPQFMDIIRDRLLPYTFIGDHLIIPDDPKGPKGISLTNMLLNPVQITPKSSPKKSPKRGKPKNHSPAEKATKYTTTPKDAPIILTGHQSVLFKHLNDVLPNKSELIKQIIFGNPHLKDPNSLYHMVEMASKR